tara:strand:+ start:318 stop:542 length:225 start_codon:yes stop_codon:yes gene_type:complete
LNDTLDKKEVKLTKEMLSKYKERLEKEIFDRSMKLKMPQNKFEEIIKNNYELNSLKKALEELENNPKSPTENNI